MGIMDIFRRKPTEKAYFSGIVGDKRDAFRPASENPMILAAAAGLSDIMTDTNRLRTNSNFTTDFDLYDSMLELDPELNGAVRAVSLTANSYSIDYRLAKNATIREHIRLLVEETLDFDDYLINPMRNLMVYGNDINKLVGTSSEGIQMVQSLPINQITISDGRPATQPADQANPILESNDYILRETQQTEERFSGEEILHIKIDYRSNWFLDSQNKWSYGIWGASRFSSLKQAIRAKYNTINNRIALEESMTKQFITIDMSAVEHITDPDEQRNRLIHIMDEVITTLEGLRGDQIPIFPDYITIHHTDTRNTLPDSTNFLDTVNADIAAVLQVPRVAAGQERGSTFAATYNASMWATNAIRRLQQILAQAVQDLFSTHITLLMGEHSMKDLPKLVFDPIEEETPMLRMQRASLGKSSGLLTLNQSLEILDIPPIGPEGDVRGGSEQFDIGETPRENSQPGATDTIQEEEEGEVPEVLEDD